MVETYDWGWGTSECLALFLIKILHDYGLKILQTCLRFKKRERFIFKIHLKDTHFKKHFKIYFNTKCQAWHQGLENSIYPQKRVSALPRAHRLVRETHQTVSWQLPAVGIESQRNLGEARQSWLG